MAFIWLAMVGYNSKKSIDFLDIFILQKALQHVNTLDFYLLFPCFGNRRNALFMRVSPALIIAFGSVV